MNAPLNDTIFAVSSPRGAGGVRAIVRLSGPGAWGAVHRVADLLPDAGVGWHEARLRVAEAELPAAVMLFRGPRSYTGEDLAELHVPNSPALLELLGRELGGEPGGGAVRLAEPGEFTARAFFNGKLDLTQAEGIAATINAANVSQLRAAASLRQGDLCRWTRDTAERLANLLALVEAGIDFADEEDIRFIEAAQVRTVLAGLREEIERQLTASRRLARRDHLPTVVFVGPPNVGKSSLINALTQRERSIVSPVAGTTRDTLASVMHLPQGDIRLLDVPGEEALADALREKMMATRRSALLEADLVVYVVAPDHADPPVGSAEDASPHLTLHNKTDLLPAAAEPPEPAWQHVSAKTGLNLAELRQHLAATVLHRPHESTGYIELNTRHRMILHDVVATVQQAGMLVEQGAAGTHPELLAAELRRGLDLLGQITGTISPDEVLGRIFSQFCLGK